MTTIELNTKNVLMAGLALLVFYSFWESIKTWIRSDLTTILDMDLQSTFALIAIIGFVALFVLGQAKVKNGDK